MGFLALPRLSSANKCSLDQRSLPLASSQWQQRRSSLGTLSLRNHTYVGVRSAASVIGHASQYENENEMLIAERRWPQEDTSWRYLTRRHEEMWLDTLDELIVFYDEHGRLPKYDVEGEEGRLATWMSDQRYAKRCLDEGKPCNNKMTPERIATLECMSWWVWNALEAAWQSQFEELKASVQTHGKIPLLSDPTLGFWVNNQRQAYRAWKDPEKYKPVASNMDEERAEKLESIPGWSWEPLEDAWAEKYQELLEYVEKHNKIPAERHPTLGFWVHNQRSAYRPWKEPEKYKPVNNTMNQERATKLELIPGWKWSFRR